MLLCIETNITISSQPVNGKNQKKINTYTYFEGPVFSCLMGESDDLFIVFYRNVDPENVVFLDFLVLEDLTWKSIKFFSKLRRYTI